MTHQILYLSQADVVKIDLPMKRIIQAVEDVLRLMGMGEVEMPPKPGIHTRTWARFSTSSGWRATTRNRKFSSPTSAWRWKISPSLL